MLVGDNLPELGTDLVAALASLDVDDLAHFLRSGRTSVGGSSPPSPRSRANASTGQLLFPSEMLLGSQSAMSRTLRAACLFGDALVDRMAPAVHTKRQTRRGGGTPRPPS